MIVDTLKDIEHYSGISASLDTGIRFLLATDLSTLSEGRHEIDGDAVYALAQSYLTAQIIRCFAQELGGVSGFGASLSSSRHV